MLPSKEVAESDNNEVLGFIASTVETIRDRVDVIEQRMATKEDLARLEGRVDVIEERMATKDDLARLDGRLSERIEVATTSIRGDIEQVHLRLDSLDHRISSRDEHFDAEISRIRSAVYVLGKDRPDVLRLLGHQTS